MPAKYSVDMSLQPQASVPDVIKTSTLAKTGSAHLNSQHLIGRQEDLSLRPLSTNSISKHSNKKKKNNTLFILLHSVTCVAMPFYLTTKGEAGSGDKKLQGPSQWLGFPRITGSTDISTVWFIAKLI